MSHIMLACAAMDALVQPCELHLDAALHLDGGDQDLIRMARSFTADVTPIGRHAHRLSMDNQWAYGYALSLSMPFDMRMTVQDLKSRCAISFPIRHAPTSLEFSFCRGKGIQATTSQGQAMNFCGAIVRVGCVHESTLFEYQAEESANEYSIHINLSVGALLELLGESELPASLEALVRSPGPLNFMETPMDAAIFALTDEIFDIASDEHLATRAGRNLYLQAKGMELIARAVERIVHFPSPGTFLREADLMRLERARQILTEHLGEPPTVADLARRVGLGEKRLKAGFKDLFGSPVMTFHRRLKLERARELLVTRAHNVTEVAALIGYANPSKFAAA